MAGVFGWRARIGLLRPSTGLNGVEEYRGLAPEGVQFIESKLFRPPGRGSLDNYPIMLKDLERATREVESANVQAIIQLGDTLSMFRGWGADNDIIARIESVAGIQATTHGVAEVEAIKHLNMYKILVFSASEENVNVKIKEYLEGGGLQVVLFKRLGDARELASGSSYGIYPMVKGTFLKAPPVDGLVILTGSIRTFEIIQALEYDTGKPVVTASQAALWKVLNMVSVKEPIRGYGRLLEMP